MAEEPNGIDITHPFLTQQGAAGQDVFIFGMTAYGSHKISLPLSRAQYPLSVPFMRLLAEALTVAADYAEGIRK